MAFDDDKVTISVKLELTGKEVKILAWEAVNFCREDPRKSWSTAEFKQAARLAVQEIMTESLEEIKKRRGY